MQLTAFSCLGLSGGGLTVSSLALAAAVLVCWYYWIHRRVLAVAWQLPTILRAFPVIGHGYLLILGFLGMMNLGLNTGKSAVARGIYTVALWIGPYPLFAVMDSEDVQTVLNNSRALERGPELKFAEFVMGKRSLLTAQGPTWKVTRRHMVPMFNLRNLELLLPDLNQIGRELVLRFSSLVDQGQVDVEPHVYTSLFKATCCLVFGPEETRRKLSENSQGFMDVLMRVSQLVGLRTLAIWLWSESIFQFLYKKEIKDIVTECKRFIQRSKKVSDHKKPVINQSWSDLDTENESQPITEKFISELGDSSSGLVTLEDAYRHLQQVHPSFTDEDLQGQAYTLMSTGADTTKITVSSCLLALAANPSVQEKLYREIMSVVGKDSDVTLDSIRDMPYLDQVLKETLRKFPIVPLNTRKAQDDIKLRNFTLPAGATVGVIFYGVHYDPRHYPDPDRFDPERFAPENIASREPHTFVAFGGGPRNCIGKAFAMMSMKTVLVHVLRRFELSTTVDIDNLTHVMGLATSSAYGYHLQLKTR